MKRKIVQHGNTSLTISLPIKWAKKFNLEKGDELNIEEKDKNLIVSTEKAISNLKIEIDITGFDEKTIAWYLQSIYKSGYDEVKIVFGNHGQMNAIQRMIKFFIGYTVMEQRGNYCVIRSISQVVEQEFESALRRTFLVTLSMAESTYEVFNTKKKEAFRSVMIMEETNNQLVAFCERLLSKYGYGNYAKTNSVSTIIGLLENIADNYRDMMKNILEKELPLDCSDETKSLFTEVNKLLRSFYEVHYKHDNQKIIVMATKINELFEDIMKRMEDCTKTERYVLYYLNSIRNLVGESIGSALVLQI